MFLNDDLNKLRRNDFLMNRRDTLRLTLWFFELDKNREKNIKRHRCRICLISYPNFILSRVNIHSVIIVHSQCTKYSGDDEYVAITIQWNNMPLTSMIVLEEETLFSLNIRCKLKDCTRQRNKHTYIPCQVVCQRNDIVNLAPQYRCNHV